MSSRKIKEEMLQVIAPEIYKPKKFKIKKKDVKPKKISSSEVEEVMYIPPQRKYQWTGRKVAKVARPGVVVTYTPGLRSGISSKRPYDEVYADNDILEQASLKTGEFAYGKQPKIESIVNSYTPSSFKEKVSVITPSSLKEKVSVVKKSNYSPYVKPKVKIETVKEEYKPNFRAFVDARPKLVLKEKSKILKQSEYKPYIKPEPGVNIKEFKKDLKIIKPKSKKEEISEVEVMEIPKKKYQWKGRKVQKVARPGVVISYTPGERSGPAIKRSSDEIFTDTDILDQAKNKINEFAYGKRQKIVTDTEVPMLITPKKELTIDIKRPLAEIKVEDTVQPKVEPMEVVKSTTKRSFEGDTVIGKKRKIDTYVPLSTHNPTPHLEPITEQKIIPMFPKSSTVQATGQVMTSSRVIKKARTKKGEAKFKVDVPMSTSMGPAVVKTDVNVMPVEPVAPGVGVRTIDITIPEKMEVVSQPTSLPTIVKEVAVTKSAPSGLKSAVVKSFQPVKLISAPPLSSYTVVHPKVISKTITEYKKPGVVEKSVTKKKYTSANSIIPVVRYHPSIKMPTKYKKKIIPKVRYHPSIKMP
ncbi:V [Bat mastadenovirus WIV17]|uniref:V n=1 Tax=Bat mastadenovirus WIV17 TaxID=1986505 RepID=A0A1X9RIS1_9ADEN|nr:V [Bat mastadenovirus WIV17] [Bat mastadenovirus WIV17]ARQ79753.1 V [Bat mastadenovirus WIV17] [Bat mastadenovirus WIV17]